MRVLAGVYADSVCFGEPAFCYPASHAFWLRGLVV